VTLRRRIAPADILITNVTEITAELDGDPPRPCSVDELRAIIADVQARHVRLALRNERSEDRAAAEFAVTLTVQVPEEDELRRVDEAFVRELAVERMDMRCVVAFDDRTRDATSASAYRTALGDYALGVLAKEQDPTADATLEFEEFAERFQRAIVVLRDFPDRPVAAAVLAVARLNLNDLRHDLTRSGIARLDRCAYLLGALAHGRAVELPPLTEEDPVAAPICHVDNATSELVNLANECWDAGSEAGLARVLERSQSRLLSPYDRVKFTAAAGAAALRHGQVELCRRAAGWISNDPVFGDWATTALEETRG
jgi:hypothetical protein